MWPLAHTPYVDAEVVCDEAGNPVIEYTSTAWGDSINIARENPEIHILFDGVVVDMGAYTPPTYSFDGAAPVPAGKGAATPSRSPRSPPPAGGTASAGGILERHRHDPDQDCCRPGVRAVHGRRSPGAHRRGPRHPRADRALRPAAVEQPRGQLGRQPVPHDRAPETVACTDDPLIIQAPPPAPLDTLIGVGAGRYNGQDGYTIEFTLVDAGEPGTRDQAALRIYRHGEPREVVLDLPLQLLSGGNLQAHYDQPHK